MKKTRTCRILQFPILVLSVFFILSPASVWAESGPHEIIAADLLTVAEPSSEAESRLRVIRLMTGDGSMGYGDDLEFGLSAKEEDEALKR